MHQVIDWYVKAVDLAKQGKGLSNQEKMILNKFKILLLSGATGDANRELAQIGKVRKDTIYKVRLLSESISEDWIRRLPLLLHARGVEKGSRISTRINDTQTDENFLNELKTQFLKTKGVLVEICQR